MKQKVLFFFVALLALVSSANATKYYVSSTGDDTNSGTSGSAAWATIDKVNKTTFLRGDQILFEAGQTFTGSILLQGAGTATQPIIVSSYGKGRATINSGILGGFSSYDAAGIEVRRLAFVGSGKTTNTDSGLTFYNSKADTQFDYLRLDSLEVSGYVGMGIIIMGLKGTSGYNNVRINFCQLHDIGECGIYVGAQALNANHDWYVGYCQVYNVSGRPNMVYQNSGNGIVLGGVDNGLIEHCLAHHNGELNGNPWGGPVGIWGMYCNNLTIQYCESHHNDSGTQYDGGGFDLDGGCTNSVLQYNYSHDNAGPGFLISQYVGAFPMHDVVVRYNVSDNDARRNGQGALEVWSSGQAQSGINTASFYNNTVRLGAAVDGSQAKAVKVMSCDYTNLTFRNNVLATSDDVIAFSTVCSAELRMEGNCYWNSNKPLLINWNGTTFNDLATLRTNTGQEKMLTNGDDTGMSVDPQLPAMLAQAPAFSSPLNKAGLPMLAMFNIDPGTHDFAGRPISASTTSLGAFEIGDGPLPVVLTSFTAQLAPSGGALLRWATASELNNAYFAIESSLDGHTFVQLAQVPGRGNSTLAQAYEYVDAQFAHAPAGVVYYRLRQVDTDGHTTYSPVRTLRNEATAALHVYPSPTAATANVLVSGAASATVQLLDVQGRLLATVPVGAAGTAQLPTAGLAAGLYLVRAGAQNTKLVLTQ